MSITTREARQLTTVAEWPLVESSLPAKIRQLSPERLKAKAERARKMRTKYADLVKRQHRKAQSKRSGQPNEKLNARTKRKAELFAEVLARYESAAKSATSKKSKKSTKRPSAKGRAKQTGSGKVLKGKAARSAKRRAAKSQGRARRVQAGRTTSPAADAAKRSSALQAARADTRAREASEARKVAEAAAASAAQSAVVAATTVAPPQKAKETRAPLVPKGNVYKRSGEIRIQAHVSSRGRRRQGRRDNR